MSCKLETPTRNKLVQNSLDIEKEDYEMTFEVNGAYDIPPVSTQPRECHRYL